jgi:hypothetical protein
MRSHDATGKGCNTTAEDHASPASLLHCRDAELREQKGRAAVCAPCLLEVVDGDVGDGLDARIAERGAGVVEEDHRCAESGCYRAVEPVDLKKSKCIGEEAERNEYV